MHRQRSGTPLLSRSSLNLGLGAEGTPRGSYDAQLGRGGSGSGMYPPSQARQGLGFSAPGDIGYDERESGEGGGKGKGSVDGGAGYRAYDAHEEELHARGYAQPSSSRHARTHSLAFTDASASADDHDHDHDHANTSADSVWDALLPVPSSRKAPTHALLPPPALRRALALGVIALFLLVLAWAGWADGGGEGVASGGGWREDRYRVKGVVDDWTGEGGKGGEKVDAGPGGGDDGVLAGIAPGGDVETMKHSWSQYRYLETLPDSAIPLNTSSSTRRLLILGDIHGSLAPLRRLMDTLAYDPARDTLLHVGDVLAKGPASLGVVEFMRENAVRGVRGNHDQKVVEWRAWMEGLAPEGESSTAWEARIDNLDAQFQANEAVGLSTLATLGRAFPNAWKWRSEHWTLARRLPAADYAYLVGLPLALHLPPYHALIVHAGLLARDLSLAPDSPFQPWTEILPSTGASRKAAELSLLRDVPANREPYNLLNMRSVRDDGSITAKSHKGTPWSELWNEDIGRCTGGGGQGVLDEEGDEGEDDEIEEVEDGEADGEGTALDRRKKKKKPKTKPLPPSRCSPVTAIYGHAAGRGLDIKPFSKGLDSACVYGKQLTALVLGEVSDLRDVKGAQVVHVGEQEGLLISEQCKKGGL